MFILVTENTRFMLEINVMSHFSERERSNYKKERDIRKEKTQYSSRDTIQLLISLIIKGQSIHFFAYSLKIPLCSVKRNVEHSYDNHVI